ncbi:glycosyltransferase family 39 protein [Acuticoccus sp.]|uniref:glycosyltransferase family 39 protein n=1 Tax=Acuticoccus sp. TaxID=1904378 RepID=UPI003B51B45C
MAGTDGTSGPPAARPWQVALVVALYVIALGAVRLGLSPFLEIDEAQFVGAVDLRLVYANSHPPLYNWLVRGALELTGWRWPLAVAFVKAALLATTYLLVFDAVRRLAGPTTGVLALALAALMPQVSWMSAHTLAHSVLVLAGAVGVVAALTATARRATSAAFLALGVAAAVGALGKANIVLLLGGLTVAATLDPFWRGRFADLRALLAPAAFALLAGPAYLAAALQLEASTARVAKLYDDGPFSALDVPLVGLDGVLSLALSALASGGLVALLVAIFARTPPPLDEAAEATRRLLWRAMGIGLGALAALVAAADATVVHERYLIPLLAPLPVVAALHLSGWPRRGAVVAAGATAFAVVPAAMAAMTAFDDHRFARPYDALLAPLVDDLPAGRIGVVSWRHDLAANLTLALRRAGREADILGDPLAGAPDLALAVDRREGRPPEAPPGFCTVRSTSIEAPLRNLTGRTMTLRATIARPC